MAVPAAVRHHFLGKDGKGKTAIVESLDTSDLRVAMERRDAKERDALDLFKAIRSGAVITPREQTAEQRGSLWREALGNIQRADDGDAYADAIYAAEVEADQFRGRDQARFDNALAGRVAVDHYVDAYLKEARLAEKTTNEWRGLVKRFGRWCDKERLRLPDIDRRNAGRYVSEEIADMHPKTAKKHLSAVRGYWEYLARRGLIEVEQTGNPWNNQLQPQRGKKGSVEASMTERPFTPDELWKVLAGPGDGKAGQFDRQLRDASLVGALSGMRLGEIVTLTVGQTSGGWFNVTDSKTQGGVRRVPVHSGLVELVDERSKGKGPGDMLFHELAGVKNAAAVTTKRFTRYRVACGVDDKLEGRRRSLANFHSLRRWFVHETEQAGQPETTVASVVGHTEGRKSMTFGVYSKGPSEEQRRACVEAVKLPPRPRCAGGPIFK